MERVAELLRARAALSAAPPNDPRVPANAVGVLVGEFAASPWQTLAAPE